MSVSDSIIEQFTEDQTAHYEPYGWHHWPAHPWMAYQFRRALGETQEGGGAVSECFQAASRMVPGDRESWHREWLAVAERNDRRGNAAEAAGHVHTAKACWLRSVDYYRSAEFWLDAADPRRLEVFTKCEAAFQKAGRYFTPPVEQVDVAYEDGQNLSGLSLRKMRRQFCLPGTWIFAVDGVRFKGAGAVTSKEYRYRGSRIPTPWAPQTEIAAKTA